MKRLFILSAILLCSACSTIKTIAPDNQEIKISNNGKKSYCKTMPRVYSGTSYYFCYLIYGEPYLVGDLSRKTNEVPLYFFDAIFSVAADTIVLPYTIYSQVNEGNIKVK